MSTAVVAAAALAFSVTSAPAGAAPNNNSAKKLTKAVTLAGVMDHLEAFQQIAETHGDRAAGRPGYKASRDYVVKELRKAGYQPTVQAFTIDYTEDYSTLERVSPQPTTYTNGEDFLRNEFTSYEGSATGALQPVDVVVPIGDAPPNTSSSGCETSDFTGFTAGNVALVQRGTCDFVTKARNAQTAGAAAVIVMNEGQPGGDRQGLLRMSGDAQDVKIPAVFTTYDTGADLSSTPGARVTVEVDFLSEPRTTWNVLAETAKGDPSNVVMAGAHLDGVQDGAGINDNGSGSAALLETAVQMAKVKPGNKVRFAWWGAEEDGLLGSTHYVAESSDEELDRIALYLNFDMVASPNYMFGIYDGDNSGGTAAPGFIPEGSAQIEDVFESFYSSRDLPFQDTDFSGRSDYGPFIAEDIPAGGLFTGAEGVKKPEEAALYGGVAGASYDPCYHAPCDNLTGEGQDEALYDQLEADYDLVGNINTEALDVNSDAIATAVITFAYDTSTVNGQRNPGKSHNGGKKSGELALKR
jgi:Zn-dependent M28 family amino/carboxypeptidase